MNGTELRDQGVEQAGSGAAVTLLVMWETKAKIAIRVLASADATFTAEDVRRAAGEPPHPNCLGAAIRQAFKRGEIRPVGVTTADRPSRHASLLRVWSRA